MTRKNGATGTTRTTTTTGTTATTGITEMTGMTSMTGERRGDNRLFKIITGSYKLNYLCYVHVDKNLTL